MEHKNHLLKRNVILLSDWEIVLLEDSSYLYFQGIMHPTWNFGIPRNGGNYQIKSEEEQECTESTTRRSADIHICL